MSLFTNPNSPSQKYSANLKRLPNKRHSRSSRPSSYASTSSRSCGSISPPTPPLSPSNSVSTFSTGMFNDMGKGEQKERKFTDRCLLIRTLHAQCGHVTHLSLHEAPCRISHYGIVSSNSHLAQAGVCEDMSVHLSISRRCCDECSERQRQSLKGLEKTGGWLRRKWNENGSGKGEGRDENVLPMKTIVERRETWLRDVEAQEARIARRRVERLRESVRSELGFEGEVVRS